MAPHAARSSLADAWDLAWRFPDTLAVVGKGRIEVWRARHVSATLRSVPMQGARYVDEVIAPIVHQVGTAGTTVIIRPVLDLGTCLTRDGYAPPRPCANKRS